VGFKEGIEVGDVGVEEGICEGETDGLVVGMILGDTEGA
jgi:hypothetical protein